MLRRTGLCSPFSSHLYAPLRWLPGACAALPNGGIPVFRSPVPSSSRGFLDIYKLASKEAIEKEKERLKDEINRGYFADINELKENGGKVAMANKTIIPSVAAAKFPELEVYFSDGKCMKLPLAYSCHRRNTNTSVSLLCLSFRANSQVMNESWSVPFSKTFVNANSVQIYEVSFIDSWILSLPPVKHLMLRAMKKPTSPSWQAVYSFGDHYDLRKKLNIVNLLTGYVFLLDRFSRIRWQGFGMATEEELSFLMESTQMLLAEE